MYAIIIAFFYRIIKSFFVFFINKVPKSNLILQYQLSNRSVFLRVTFTLFSKKKNCFSLSLFYLSMEIQLQKTHFIIPTWYFGFVIGHEVDYDPSISLFHLTTSK